MYSKYLRLSVKLLVNWLNKNVLGAVDIQVTLTLLQRIYVAYKNHTQRLPVAANST